MPEDPASRRVRVGLGARSYDIEIGSGLMARSGALLTPFVKAPRVFVISDETVAGLYFDRLAEGLRPAGLSASLFTIAPGESAKSLTNLEAALDWLLAAGASRSDLLIALGGGVVGDLGGLAASLMKRGMGLVQVPTTLLSQVDSSVGGKTAVNTRFGKNLIGAFYQPRQVMIDTDVLASLPEREKAAGYAEVVKYGLIDDTEFFDWLEEHGRAVMELEPGPLVEAIARSCQSKANIVGLDEREGGVRALLNLGHTFGHALEAENGFGPELLHGEAVACGMMLALRYSARKGLMPHSDVDRAERVLAAAGLPVALAKLDGGPYLPAQMIEHMKQDKKARGGSVPLILARGIGASFIQPDADLSDVELFLEDEAAGAPA